MGGRAWASIRGGNPVRVRDMSATALREISAESAREIPNSGLWCGGLLNMHSVVHVEPEVKRVAELRACLVDGVESLHERLSERAAG